MVTNETVELVAAMSFESVAMRNPLDRKMRPLQSQLIGLLSEVNRSLCYDAEEKSTIQGRPRSFDEIVAAIEYGSHQLRYAKFLRRSELVASGQIQIVPRSPRDKLIRGAEDVIDSRIWDDELLTSKQIEEALGPSNLGPWDAEELKEIEGRLAALNWLVGADWPEEDY